MLQGASWVFWLSVGLVIGTGCEAGYVRCPRESMQSRQRGGLIRTGGGRWGCIVGTPQLQGEERGAP